MSEKQRHYTIDSPRKMTIKIRRSVFTCTLAPVENIDAAKAFISSVSKKNKQATHNCWAYILGEKGETFHSSDAGEPAGTAGRPMLHALQTNQLSQLAAVVTRFYGGVKLGVRGLIDAYGQSVQAAIDKAPLAPLLGAVKVRVELAYEFNDIFLAQMRPFICQVSETAYTQKIIHTIEFDRATIKNVQQQLSDLSAQKKIKYSMIPSD
jgi:uncharacterized YigZ family protein